MDNSYKQTHPPQRAAAPNLQSTKYITAWPQLNALEQGQTIQFLGHLGQKGTSVDKKKTTPNMEIVMADQLRTYCHHRSPWNHESSWHEPYSVTTKHNTLIYDCCPLRKRCDLKPNLIAWQTRGGQKCERRQGQQCVQEPNSHEMVSKFSGKRQPKTSDPLGHMKLATGSV